MLREVDEERSRELESLHFWRVVHALLSYESRAIDQVTHWKSELSTLPPLHTTHYSPLPHFTHLLQCASFNQAMFNSIASPRVVSRVFGFKVPDVLPMPSHSDMEKTRSTLRIVARDWSEEGREERRLSYGPIVEALEGHWGDRKERAGVKVLCPGSGVGRLALDVNLAGFGAVGNEFSYFMLLASHKILNGCRGEADRFTIYPWATEASNVLSRADQTRAVTIPDVIPGEARVQAGVADVLFAMAAGDFLEIFDEEGSFDAVATCFFIDTAHNVFQYIDAIVALLPVGGVWVNLGPLLWHFAGIAGESSIEPCWEDIRAYIDIYFEIRDEKILKNIPYTSNQRSLMRTVYDCIFFKAIKK
jgi:carnosine N-methyltransferase